jgi:hypothetical protein
VHVAVVQHITNDEKLVRVAIYGELVGCPVSDDFLEGGRDVVIFRDCLQCT